MGRCRFSSCPSIRNLSAKNSRILKRRNHVGFGTNHNFQLQNNILNSSCVYHSSNAVVGATDGGGANVVGMIKRRQGNYFFLGAIDCTKKSVSVMPIIAVSLV